MSTDPTLDGIDVRDLVKTFRRGPETVRALDGVSFHVRPGEVVALTGPSGSGKSTLIDVVLGWQTPDSGSVEFSEEQRIGVVPQRLGLFEELTAQENAAVAARISGAVAVPDVLDQLDVFELADRMPQELSLGQQQRFAVARAVAAEPSLLIADEPTSHQDAERASLVMVALRASADRGAAVLLTSHDRRITEQCDRVLRIVDGRLAAEAETTPLLASRSFLSDQSDSRGAASSYRRRIAPFGLAVLLTAGVTLGLLGARPRDTTIASVASESTRAEAISEGADLGTVEEIMVVSEALGTSQRTLVFLPPGYARNSAALPTIYLLHNENSSPDVFSDIGLFRRAGSLMEQGLIAPSIIVAPTIGNSFGVNNPTSGEVDLRGQGRIECDSGRYEDFLSDELVPAIEDQYRVRSTRQDRSVGGMSMGGFAALHLGLRHPELFARVAGHSPLLVDVPWLFPTDDVQGSRDPRVLARSVDPALVSGIDFYLDVGEQDELDLLEPVTALANELGSVAEVTLRTRPGTHSNAYWRQRVDEYLVFHAGE